MSQRHNRSASTRSGDNVRHHSTTAQKLHHRRSVAAQQQKLPSSVAGDDSVHIRMDAPSEDDEGAMLRKKFQDIGDRRIKEWENHQRSQRTNIDQPQSKVCFDFSISDQYAGRVIVELMDDVVPLTVANFKALVSGEGGYDLRTGTKLDYTDSIMCRNSKTHVTFGELNALNMAAVPDPEVPNRCIKDENFSLRHSARGLLSMRSCGPHTSGSAFCLMLDKCPELDFKQVVFGKIIEGISVLERLESVAVSRTGVPKVPVTISFCAVLTGSCPDVYYRSLEDFKLEIAEAETEAEAAATAAATPPSEAADKKMEREDGGEEGVVTDAQERTSPELKQESPTEDSNEAAESSAEQKSPAGGSEKNPEAGTREGTPTEEENVKEGTSPEEGQQEQEQQEEAKKTQDEQPEDEENLGSLDKIYFLRHCGDADETQTLTEKDIESAELWGSLLGLCNITSVFCSSHKRCLDTVQATADNDDNDTMLCEKLGLVPSVYDPDDLEGTLFPRLDAAPAGNAVVCYSDAEIEAIWAYLSDECAARFGAGKKTFQQRCNNIFVWNVQEDEADEDLVFGN